MKSKESFIAVHKFPGSMLTFSSLPKTNVMQLIYFLVKLEYKSSK